MQSIEALVAALTEKNTALACASMKALAELSAASPAVYPYFDRFARMMKCPNSYVRTRGLLLIAANARWDADGRIDGILDEFLGHILDEKPITARQFIQALPGVAACKPELRAKIERALRSSNPARYPDSMRPLIEKDIRAALSAISALPPA